MEKETAKECLLILTKIYIQETGKTVKNMDKELMFISTHKAEYNKLIQYTGEFYEGKII